MDARPTAAGMPPARDGDGGPRTRHRRGWSHSSSPDMFGRDGDADGEQRLLDDDALEDEVERAVEAYEAAYDGHQRRDDGAIGDSDSAGGSRYDTADEGASLGRRARPKASRRTSERKDAPGGGGSSSSSSIVRRRSSQAARQQQGLEHRQSQEQAEDTTLRFDLLDHFTLRSSLFRHGNQVVINGMRHQLIFDLAYEDVDDPGDERGGTRKLVLSVKRASMYGGWIFFLKFLYIYVVLFLVGATVVFCILIPVQYGLGVFLVGIRSVNDTDERMATLLTLLAMPSFVESLSIMSTLIIGYFSDIWNDFEFINTMTLVRPLVRDWIILTAILFVPLGSFAVSFLLRSASPITNALLAALWCSLGLFALTMLYTLWIEVYSCLKIMQTCVPQARTLRHAFFYLLRHRLRQRFAFTYWPGMDPALEGVDLDEAGVLDHLDKRELSPFAQWFYNPVKPRRLWTIDTVLKPRPILSRQDFSVFFLCCLTRSRFRGSISRSSVRSSFACVLLSSFLIWLVVVGYLVYSTFIPTILVVLAGLVSFAIFVTWIGHNLAWMQEFKRGTQGLIGTPRAPRMPPTRRATASREQSRQQSQEQRLRASSSDKVLMTSYSASTLSRNPFADDDDGSGARAGGATDDAGEQDRQRQARDDEDLEAGDHDHVALEDIDDFADDADDEDEDYDGVANASMATPVDLDIDAYQRIKSMRESRFVYAEPKIWVAILLLMGTFGIFVGAPMYGFSQLGVGGYAAFFTFACCLSIQRFVFNVPSLVETFGPKAVESLELPLFDFMEENEGSAAAAASAVGTTVASSRGVRYDDESQASSSPRLGQGGSPRQSRLMAMASVDRQTASAKVSNGGRRVHLVLTRMAQQQIRTFWIGCFALAVIFMIMMVGFSVDQDTTLSDYQGVPLLGNATHKTHYVPAPTRGRVGFMYPVCTLFDTLYAGKNDAGVLSAGENGSPPVDFGPLEEAKLTTLDFVFLSDLAYSHAQTSQQQLDRWFGPKAVRYIPPEKYEKYAAPRLSSAVFKLIHIPSREQGGNGGDREVFLVSVRGTINTYDLLSDMQIWFPAMLFQWLRFVLPFGAVWNSVIPSLISYMNVLETAPSNRLSYQADLMNFVRALRAKNPHAFVAITGHSLGGGIAMLVGAAESVPAIGISGPNAVLSRLKFGLDQSKLDSFAVNIIPRGDPIPTVDDQALLTESILCRVDQGAYLGACHELKRTFCELQYICGSGDRPPVAICNSTYNFPAAIHIHSEHAAHANNQHES